MSSLNADNPGYVQLAEQVYKAAKWRYNRVDWENYSIPSSAINELNESFYFNINSEGLTIFLIGVVFTLVRYFLEVFVFKPFADWVRIDNELERVKFPESAWKLLVYSCMWGYVFNLLILNVNFNYFFQPNEIWNDWHVGMAVPEEIKFIYFIQSGFYVHSVYATLYMDEKRKDFFVMLIHHFLTITLIVVSYATRYHKSGIMILFVHDITDIILEFTKCNVYLKNRGGKYYALNDHLSTLGFLGFATGWFWFRLYWFPLKILYSTTVVAAYKDQIKGYTFFNSLLWFLLCLDIYWFYFILVFLVKVATGQIDELKDTRENEKEAKKKIK